MIEGTRLYLAVVLLLMVGLSYFLEKMSKASTEKKAKQSDYQLLESQREFVANISHEYCKAKKILLQQRPMN